SRGDLRRAGRLRQGACLARGRSAGQPELCGGAPEPRGCLRTTGPLVLQPGAADRSVQCGDTTQARAAARDDQAHPGDGHRARQTMTRRGMLMTTTLVRSRLPAVAALA